jgi:transcriptional regulator with PAS, ATPase and Fis domain
MRGAFTGADRDKIGLAEHADQGTLFLDEIGDMPLGTQAKLLRVLQNQEVQRIGSLTPRRVDIRVIAATNRNLRQAIAEKQFREDLYYRLSMVEIQVPSLVERIEDLPLLTQHFVQQFAGQYGKQISGLTRRAQIVLSRHAWPGNVRELENVIGHACMMALGEVIDVTDLPEYLRRSPSAAAVSGNEQAQTAKRTIEQDPIEQNPTEQSRPGLPEAAPDLTFEDHEKHLLTAALEKAAGNQSEAARQLRIGRDALRYKMKKYGLI